MQSDPIQPIQRRRGNPACVAGAPSVNPSGRAKGFAGVARQIMSETGDASELVAFALRVLRDDEARMEHRMAALHWLSDRSLGKPLATVELHGTLAATTSAPSFGDLSVEELRAEIARRRAVLTEQGSETPLVLVGDRAAAHLLPPGSDAR
jgi:hypothetical protein